MAIVTMKGCSPCKPMVKLIKKEVKGKLPILEIPAEKAECDPLITKLHVSESPTILFFRGKSVKRITDGDKTDDEIKSRIAAIVGKGKK